MKIKNRMFGKNLEEIISKTLRGAIMIIAINILFFYHTGYAQQEINIVNEGLIEVRDTILGVDTVISSHSSKDNAIESLVNYANKTGRKTARIYGQKTRVDVLGIAVGTPAKCDTVYVDKPIEVILKDTIYINTPQEPITDIIKAYRRSSEIKGWIDLTEGNRTYLPFETLGMVEVDIDSVINWQRIYKLERTKNFGYTTYKSLDIPFQFVEWWLEGTMFYAKISAKQTNIKAYLNGVLMKEFSPGYSNDVGDGLFIFNFAFINLLSGDNLARIEVTNASGETDSIEFNIQI